jgi:hypothetical protein
MIGLFRCADDSLGGCRLQGLSDNLFLIYLFLSFGPAADAVHPVRAAAGKAKQIFLIANLI